MVARNRRTRAHWIALCSTAIVLVIGGLGGADAAAARGAAPARAATPIGGTSCSGDVATSTLSPVLLVHGTAMSAEENWDSTLAPHLATTGHAVCLVALTSYGTSDVQDSIEVVARAIRTVAATAGRPIDVIGHSQGAYLPRAALRLRPDLVPLVDDVVGIAGVYDVGSEQLATRCAGPCVPALHQLAARSALLSAISRRPLPAGPSYTNIGSTGDRSVTPQPVANQQRGTTSVLLQDVCADRTLQDRDHALIVGDAVAASLVADALDQDGPADPTRIPVETCSQTWYDGFDPEAFASLVSTTGARTRNGRIAQEPTLDCRLRVDCRDLAVRGRVLRRPTWTVGRYRVALRAVAAQDGKVKLTSGSRSVSRTVRTGDVVSLSIARSGRTGSATLFGNPRYYSAWVGEYRRSWTG